MITLKDVLRLKPAPDEPVHDYLLVKVASLNKLFKVQQKSINEEDLQTEEGEENVKQDLIEVQEFANVPALLAQKDKQLAVKALSFFDHLLLLLIEDSQLLILDIHQSWSDPVFSCNLQNLNNIKLAKVSED